ncbi:NUP155 [Symbiodinium sp. KB8]|nr:NUP155 [Symbiodinium sp. KB8]
MGRALGRKSVTCQGGNSARCTANSSLSGLEEVKLYIQQLRQVHELERLDMQDVVLVLLVLFVKVIGVTSVLLQLLMGDGGPAAGATDDAGVEPRPRRDGNLQQRPRADHAEAERATFTTVRVATVPAHIGWQASTSEASAGQAGAVGSASLVFRFGTQAKLPKPSGRVVKPAAASESGARPVSAAFGAFSVEAMRAEKTSLKAMVFVATQLYQAVVGLCTPVRPSQACRRLDVQQAQFRRVSQLHPRNQAATGDPSECGVILPVEQALFYHSSLPFASVGRSLLIVPGAHFVDDFYQSEDSEASCGPEFQKKLVASLSDCLQTGTCSRPLAARLAGKLTFVCCRVFGRAGQPEAAVPLTALQFVSRGQAAASNSREFCTLSRTFASTQATIFTSISRSVNNMNMRIGRLYADAFITMYADRRCANRWMQSNAALQQPRTRATSVLFVQWLEAIAQLISIAVVARDQFDCIVCFLDNTAAEHALNKGTSKNPALCWLIGSFGLWVAKQGLGLRISLQRVPSQANVSDKVSRQDFSEADYLLSCQRVEPLFEKTGPDLLRLQEAPANLAAWDYQVETKRESLDRAVSSEVDGAASATGITKIELDPPKLGPYYGMGGHRRSPENSENKLEDELLSDSQGQLLNRFNRAMAAAMPASDAGMRRMVTDNSVMSFTPGEIADARCDALLAMIEEERGARKQEVQEIHKMLIEVFAKLQNSSASDNRKSIFVHDTEQASKGAESSLREPGDLDNRFAELESFCKSLKSELEHFVKCEAEERFHQLDRMLAEWRQVAVLRKFYACWICVYPSLHVTLQMLQPAYQISNKCTAGLDFLPSVELLAKSLKIRCANCLLDVLSALAAKQTVVVTAVFLEGFFSIAPPRPVSPIAVPAGAPGYIGQAQAGVALRTTTYLQILITECLVFLMIFSTWTGKQVNPPQSGVIFPYLDMLLPEQAAEMDGGLGVGLLEEAFRSPAEENVGPAYTVEWDHSLAELTHASRSPIPGQVREAFGRARQRANCGLFAEGLAWASLDEVLYLWDYSDMSPSVHSVPGDSAIISVALCPAKSGIFETQQPRWVLVIATRLSVSLVGVNFARKEIRASRVPDATPANVSLSDWTSSARAGIPGVPVNSTQSQSSLHFVPLQGFRALSEGALFHSIHSSPGGRIFLLSGAPHIYELLCSQAGWYRAKCRLVRHCVGPGWWKSPKPGRLRLLSCGPAGHILTCDDVGTLRLCWAMDQIGGSSTLEELASLTAVALRDQVRAITQGSLASFTLTHLFCWMGATGQLLLDATTIAGERLHFVCSVEGSTRRKYGFWLQHLASSWSSRPSAESHESRSVRISCLEEHPDPCFFAPGADGASTLGSVWLCAALRRAGASASDLAVSVRLNGVPHDHFQPLSPKQAVEMQGMLSFDAPVLAIAQEQSQPTCQKFAVLLADRVQTVTIAHQASAAKRAPAEAAECCLFLQSLASGTAPGGATGSRIQYDWCWSLDDARFPTFEEQRRASLAFGTFAFSVRDAAQCLDSAPALDTGRARVVEVPSLPLSLCRKRRRCASPPVVAISEMAARKIFSQLEPVIHFVAKGLAHNAEEQVPFGTPCSAVMRAQLYVKRTEAAHAPSSCDSAQARVRRAMLELLDVMDRTRQVLGLIFILHKSGCTQAVLESAPLQEHDPATASHGVAEPADVLLPSAASLLLSRSLRDLVLSPVALWFNYALLWLCRQESMLFIIAWDKTGMADQSIPPAELKQRRKSLNESRLKTARLSVAGTSHTPRPEQRSQGRTKRQLDKRPVLRLLAELAPALKEERSTADSASDVFWLALAVATTSLVFVRRDDGVWVKRRVHKRTNAGGEWALGDWVEGLEAKEVAGGVTAPGEFMRTEISLVAVPMEMVEDSILGAALLCVFWYIGQCGGRFLAQNWKYLPIPSAADVTTFAVLSALRPSDDVGISELGTAKEGEGTRHRRLEFQSSDQFASPRSSVEGLGGPLASVFFLACERSPRSELWLSLTSLAEEEDADSDDFAEFRMKRETSGSSAQDVFKVDGVVLEPEHVAAGARALYRKLAPHGLLNFDKLHTVIENDIETNRLWALLQALDEESEIDVNNTGKTVMERQRSISMPVDASESQSAEPKIRRSKRTKSSGHIEQTVGVDAFVHLVVSTYKEAARLVSTVGEHSAVFALFCSVLSVLRLSVLVVVAVGRFAPITVLQTLSWLLSSVLLAVSFAWGPVLLDILQSLVLLLHVNPFDTGDMIIFRGNYLHVQQIKLLNTVFRDLCDEEIYIRNSVLYADCEGILNIRRSGRASAAIELLIPPQSATKPNLKALTAAARRYAMAHPETWQEQVSVGVFPTNQPGAAVVVGMEVRACTLISVELKDCCPAIFSQVDLKRCLRRADWRSTSSKQALSMLQRYAGSLPTGSSPPEWQLLCRGIRALASEEPGMAAELCAERVCKLADSWPDSEERCRDLISSLLDAMSLERLAEAATALEVFLKRSRASACKLPGSNEPVFHHITFDHLLSTPRLHALLEAVLNTNAADVKAILQRRSASSRTASELLWRYFQRQGHDRPAWVQLQRLVEAPEQFYNLKDRIRYLHLAQEQRKSVSSASLQEELALRLGAAEKLQQPLLKELLVLAGNEKQDARWRDAARKRSSELQHLRSARELYEVAGEFGFWHLQLGIAGFSGVNMAHDVATTLWAGFLFPADGPYNSHSDEVASPKLLFPLLMRRPHTCFFASKQEEMDERQLKPSLLRDRVLAFLQELKEVAPTSHQLWHVRGIATLLEFSSCLWLNALQKVGQTTELQEKGGDGAAGSSLIDENRLWVALEVLMQKPFSFSLPDLITFYAEMIAQLDAWHTDLQETSAYSQARRWAWPTEEDVHLHLSHVAIVLLASWLREAERTCESISESCAEAESEFVRVWRRSADGLLSGLCLRLNHARHHSAQRLLGEALRLEKGCRLLLDRVVYLGPEKHFAGEAQSAQRDDVHEIKYEGALPPLLFGSRALSQSKAAAYSRMADSGGSTGRGSAAASVGGSRTALARRSNARSVRLCT